LIRSLLGASVLETPVPLWVLLGIECGLLRWKALVEGFKLVVFCCYTLAWKCRNERFRWVCYALPIEPLMNNTSNLIAKLIANKRSGILIDLLVFSL
jgi:hypothetical protein